MAKLYFKFGAMGSSKTAQALFLHRNTLLLRIRRMEEITGCDLSRSETLLEMGMALRVRPML